MNHLHPHDAQRMRELQMLLAQHGGQGQMPPQMGAPGVPPPMPPPQMPPQGLPPQAGQMMPQGMPFGGGMPPQSGPMPPPGVDPRMAIAQAMGPQGMQAPPQAGMDPARMAAMQKLQAAMSAQPVAR